jgi:hypothetical protein
MSTDDMLDGLVDQEHDHGEDAEQDEHQDEPENLYPDVAAFVEGFLVTVYARPVNAQKNDFRWCTRWWEHAEAVSRLEALWKAFETLRQDPGTGAAVWWRDYADPTMNALCSNEGAFKQCSDTQHKVYPDLPVVSAPDWFRQNGTK